MEKFKIEPSFESKGFLITKLNNKGKYSFCFYVQSLREANWYLKNPEAIEQQIVHNRNTTYSVIAFVIFLIIGTILTLK